MATTLYRAVKLVSCSSTARVVHREAYRSFVTLSARSHVLPSRLSIRRYAHGAASTLEVSPEPADVAEAAASEETTSEETTSEKTTSEEPASEEPASEETYSQQPEFRSLAGKVSDKTLKALTESPFKLKHMSSVQSAVLSLLPSLADPSADSQSSEKARDLLVKAKTGTGKTIAFLVPAIEARLKALEYAGAQAVRDAGLAKDPVLEKKVQRKMAHNEVGALIISPTRELAMQIAAEAVRVTHHQDLEVRTLVGGLPMKQQMYEWRNGRVDIVVATPGRLRDALENHPSLSEGLRKSQTLILDEADTLLEMGFRPDLDAIVEQLPKTPQRQTFLFSATLSRPIRQIAQAYLDPSHKFIDVVPENDTPVHASIPQYHTVLPTAEHQIPHILRLIAHDQLTNTGRSKILLFLPTTKMTQLFNTLIRDLSKTILPSGRKTRIYELHSKRTQGSRSSTSDAFRADKTGASILVSSDVSARGVDYPGVTRVIQVGVPSSPDQYVHRVGRTGRAGSKGRGDLVLLPFEANFVRWQLSDIPIKPLTVHQLTEDVDALVAKYEQDPSAFWTNVQPVQQPLRQYRDGRFAAPAGPVEFPADVQARMAAMSTHIATLLDSLDVEAIRETLGSLLGYYVSRAAEMRAEKNDVLEGLRTWSMEALGLPQAPHFSDAFLAKIGMSGSARRGGGGGGGGGSFGKTRDFRRTASPLSDRPRRDRSEWVDRSDRPPRSDRPQFGRRSTGEGFTPRSSGEGFTPRSSGDFPRRSSGDFPRRSSGDFPRRSSGDFPRRSSGDFPRRSSGDFPRRAPREESFGRRAPREDRGSDDFP